MGRKRCLMVALLAVFAAILILLECGKKNPVTLESPSGNIDQNGGTVLVGDISLVIPPNAVSGNTSFWVKPVEPSQFFGADTTYRRIVVSCSSSVAFSGTVELRVPYPQGMTAADSVKLIAGCIDDTSGVVTMYKPETRVIDGKTYAILSIPHFSNWVYEWFCGPVPPETGGPLPVPYYNQGSTNFCWATCTQMITQAATWNEDAQVNDIIGRMQIDDGGISALQFRYSSTLGKIIKERTGLSPDRNCWDFVNYEQIKDYAKRAIGVCGLPVTLFMGHKNHVITLVGYDGDNFIVHDPQSTTPDAIGYTTVPWSTLTRGFGTGSSMVTVAIPGKPLDHANPHLSLAIASGAFRIIRPAANSSQQSTTYTQEWSYKRPSGFCMVASTGSIADTIPAGISKLEQSGDVELYNSSRTETKTVSVWLDLAPITSGPHPSYSDRVSVTLPPNSLRTARFSAIPAEAFVDTANADGAIAREYQLSVRVLENSVVEGRSSFRFWVRAKAPTITDVTPPSALPGMQIRIHGSYFGSSRATRNVVFRIGKNVNASIVSWSDTLIVAKVPADATPTGGDLFIANSDGSAASNYFSFSVIDNQSPCTLSVNFDGGDADSTTFFGFGSKIITYEKMDATIAYVVADSLDTLIHHRTDPEVEIFLSGKHRISIQGIMHNWLSCGNHAEFKKGNQRQVVDFDQINFKRSFQDIGGSFTVTPHKDSCSFRFDFDAATDWPYSTTLHMGADLIPSQHWSRQNYIGDSLVGTDTGSITYGYLRVGCWRNYQD